MQPKIVKARALKEYFTPEGCFIFENWGLVSAKDPNVSIARARVKPGAATTRHHLEGIQEIYLITQGKGKVEVGILPVSNVAKGDVVVIPAGISQKIENTGKTDLIFYCICTPAFEEKYYFSDDL
jgi:mannose-6-phosphate isomerase-like protein (cupin superfamily)